jgi:L-fuculose-phosphate aldolase
MDEIAEQMCELGRRAYAAGLVAGSEGNLSARLADGRILCTPTGRCKGWLTPADLCVVDSAGAQVAGRLRPSSEMPLHVAIYSAAPSLRAVVHTHPPFATTLSVLDEVSLANVLPEGDIFLGDVPFVPYQTPGTADMARPLLPLLRDHDAVILRNHGAITWATDLESAYLLMETLEAVCRVVYQARQVGIVRLIPPEQRGVLAALRQRWRARSG